MYTYRRQGRFYFQYVFPKVLANRFKERAIRFSLLTYDRRYAKRLAQLHHFRCLELEFKSFEAFAEVVAFVRDIGNVGTMKTLSELVGSSKDDTLQTALKLLDSYSVPFYLEIDPARTTYGTVNDAFASVVKPKDKTLVQIPYFIGQAKIALIDTSLSPTLGDVPKPYQTAHLHQLKVKDVPANVLSEILAEKTRSAAPVVSNPFKHPPLPLSKAFEEFAAFKGPGIESKTLGEYKYVIDLFIEVHGDLDITELNTLKYNEFTSLVKRMPPNRTKGELDGKHIRELVALGLKPVSMRKQPLLGLPTHIRTGIFTLPVTCSLTRTLNRNEFNVCHSTLNYLKPFMKATRPLNSYRDMLRAINCGQVHLAYLPELESMN